MPEITIVPGTIKLLKMTDAEYFSKQYKDYISNSKLSLINPDEDGSFEKYQVGFKQEYSDSFELGSAIHAMLLQPNFFHIANINKPTGKLGVFAEEVFRLRQKNYKILDAILEASQTADYYAASLSPKRIKTAITNSLDFYIKRLNFKDELGKQTLFLSSPIKAKLDQCLLKIAEEPKFNETLYPVGLFAPHQYYNEYAILCELDYTDTETGEITRLKFKAKLDNFTLDHEECVITLNDLKSSGKPVNYFMGNYVNTIDENGDKAKIWYNGSFQKYHYYRQMAVYFWLLQSALSELWNIKNYQLKANMLVVETIPEFNCKIFPVNGKQIKVGLDEFKDLLTLVVQWMQKKQKK